MSVLTAASAALLAPCLFQGQSDVVLTVRAWVATAGPYGESWTLIVPEQGEVSLEVAYMLAPMGKMSGGFCVTSEALDDARRAIGSQRFMELPAQLQPEPAYLHRPMLRLRVGLGGEQHEVEVYDPDAMADDPRVARFLAVWTEVFSIVPVQPKWPPQDVR